MLKFPNVCPHNYKSTNLPNQWWLLTFFPTYIEAVVVKGFQARPWPTSDSPNYQKPTIVLPKGWKKKTYWTSHAPPLSTIIDVSMHEFEYFGAPVGMYCCTPLTLNDSNKDLEISHCPLHSGLSAKISTKCTSDMAM
jgi:hypothetical protein